MENEKIEIRRFAEGDCIDAVSRVYALSWKAAYRGIVPQDYLNAIQENRWSDYLEKELSHLWIVGCGERIAGASTYGPGREEAYRGWGEIISIYLTPDLYRKGIGARLLRASMNELFHMGYGGIYLWVLEENQSARRFYEKMGFRFNGDRQEDIIGGKPLNEIRYIYRKESE